MWCSNRTVDKKRSLAINTNRDGISNDKFKSLGNSERIYNLMEENFHKHRSFVEKSILVNYSPSGFVFFFFQNLELRTFNTMNDQLLPISLSECIDLF